jgi:hypothetical protein
LLARILIDDEVRIWVPTVRADACNRRHLMLSWLPYKHSACCCCCCPSAEADNNTIKNHREDTEKVIAPINESQVPIARHGLDGKTLYFCIRKWNERAVLSHQLNVAIVSDGTWVGQTDRKFKKRVSFYCTLEH